MHNVRINPLALKDLQEIKNYIAEELESPAAAINVVSSIIESYEKLKEFPLLGGELVAKINISTDLHAPIKRGHHRKDENALALKLSSAAGDEVVRSTLKTFCL